MAGEETHKTYRSGGLTAEDRLERIEEALGKLNDKLDSFKTALSDGSTRFATIDLTIQSLTHRIDRLENARDAVVKIVMGAVLVSLLALIGLKMFA